MPTGMIGDYDPRSEMFPLELECLAEVPPGGTMLDVGACVGGASLCLLDSNPTAVIHAFEPNPHNFVHLRALPVHAVQAAVGASAGVATLYTTFPSDCERGDLLGSLRRRAQDATAGAGEHAVRVVALDDYCADNGVERVDLLKVDVEGHELGVFLGADRLLSEGRIDVAVFERIGGWRFVDGYEPALDPILAFLEERGYEAQMERAGRGWAPSGVPPDRPNVRVARRR